MRRANSDILSRKYAERVLARAIPSPLRMFEIFKTRRTSINDKHLARVSAQYHLEIRTWKHYMNNKKILKS